MLQDNISYKCQLRKLQNKKELTSDGYSKQIEEARKSGADRDELDYLRHEAHMVDLYSDHNIRAFQSRYLIKKLNDTYFQYRHLIRRAATGKNLK